MSVEGRGARDRMQFRDVVALGQGMHPECRWRDRGLSQRQSRGRSRIQERDAKALTNEYQRKGGPTDARTQDCNVDLKRFGFFHAPDANIRHGTVQSSR